LASEVSTVAPARLLTLLGQSLKWQQQQGLVQPDSAFDLFRGTNQVVKVEEDAVPTKQYTVIKVWNFHERSNELYIQLCIYFLNLVS
jgi:WD40 repeat-containing protein SMU1